MNATSHVAEKLIAVLVLLGCLTGASKQVRAGFKIRLGAGTDCKQRSDTHPDRCHCDKRTSGHNPSRLQCRRSPGYYTVVTDQVLVSRGYHTVQYIQPVIETRYDRYGRLYQHVVTPGRYRKVWIPATYHPVRRRVWVPLSAWRPGYRTGYGVPRRGGVELRFNY